MTTILVPYHQDERLLDGEISVAADIDVRSQVRDGDVWRHMAGVCSATAAAVSPVVAAGRVPVVVSGDCLVAGGTVAGVQVAGVDPAVVWFDAHGDVHTLQTSTSGYLGGLALRLLNGAHPERYADVIGLRPVPAERTVLVDARDLDPAEIEYLAGSATRRIPVPEVSADTVPSGPLVLHVDVDVIDSGAVPGLRYPAPDGPSADAVLAACARLFATDRVVAFDVACPWSRTEDEGQRDIRKELLSRLTALATH
ncbi:arginase family protein [Verrucosispora sp. WMMA2121]|uniref:arginase family protein n=1 Tax=Verrucosispora sp. WMMA2121 TaxID=3015164 RepID=UPI0022B68C49|nr:arginase family protein [Verrucosispora sp. WMMA2121]MCZ7422930.1 arginase family protein [Verrucosispora sp. WMMA2121]